MWHWMVSNVNESIKICLYEPHNWLKLILKPPLKLFGHWNTPQNHCYAHLEGLSRTDHTDELRQRHLQDDRHSLAAVHSRPDQLVIAIFTQQPVHQTLLRVCTRSTCGRTQTHTCQITPHTSRLLLKHRDGDKQEHCRIFTWIHKSRLRKVVLWWHCENPGGKSWKSVLLGWWW